ncbi:MAG: glycine--tRNA ligase subunit beta [Planctomycetota bacterium]|nr:glycine--tRNA ligase subunit beta [Planctomycetota bacterium]
MPDLLLEIGVEELPASYIEPALERLASSLKQTVELLEDCEPRLLATPRRLVLHYSDVAQQTQPKTTEVKGPPKRACFDKDGNATRALTGFLGKHGASQGDETFKEVSGREYCFVETTEPARRLSDMLAEQVPNALSKLTFPKNMRWTEENTTFARPVRTIACMVGEQPVSFVFNGVRAGAHTRGHLVLSREKFELESADLGEYLDALEGRKVVVDVEERKRRLVERFSALARQENFVFKADEELLAEVAFQVEWPNAVLGKLADKYMELPRAVLATTLKHHQYAFLLNDSSGEPAGAFVAACNMPGDLEQLSAVVRGYENVCSARLEDALFFYREDMTKDLRKLADKLDGVIFHPKLGTYADKVQRVKDIIAKLCEGSRELSTGQCGIAMEAAELSRADLLTGMVYELPELQGRMGRIYAEKQKTAPPVARAMEELYMPVASGAPVPSSLAGCVLSLADRVDTLAAFFAMDLRPTSASDPFGLRRHAYAIIRILHDRPLTDDLFGLFCSAVEVVAKHFDIEIDRRVAVENLCEFFCNRLYNELVERYPYDIVRAVHSVCCDYSVGSSLDVSDVFTRVEALNSIRDREGFEELCTTLERAKNITRDLDDEGEPDISLVSEDEEKVLFEAYRANRDLIKKALAQGSGEGYAEGARRYVEAFAKPLHEFFEEVYVNVENDALRLNRLRLLRKIYLLLAGNFADLTRVVIDG